MKRNTIGLTLIAAAALSLSSAFAADCTNITADVPFAFQVAGGATLPAGKYAVTSATNSAANALRFQNTATGQSVMALGIAPLSVAAGESQPKLRFNCDDGGCWLSQVWNGEGGGRQFRKPSQHASSGTERVAVIYGSVIATR